MNKDRLFGVVLVVCMSAAMTACNIEDALSTDGVEDAITSQTFSGRVVDPNGTAISGARVTINGIVRITGATGQYAVSISDSRTGYRIDIRKDGFGPVTEFRLAGELSLVHRMEAGFTKVIKPNASNVVTDPSGIQVTIPANALRSSKGAPTGDVRFTIIPHTSQTMPGDFTARNATGAPVALVSVGAVTLQALDSQDNTLGLAAGVVLNVKLPVPAAAGGTMPTCVLTGACRVALWRFTPASGLWVEQSVVSPAFTTTATTFGLRALQNGVIDPADGLGTLNADIEFTNPACTVINFSSFPLECFNPAGTTPEPGITFSFTQALSGGGTKSKTEAVRSSAAFLVLYNLRSNVDVDLSFTFPAGAPANCAANLVFATSPMQNVGFPVITATGGATRLSTGAPWGGTGYPTDPGGLPIDFLDVAVGDTPCHSRVTIATSP